jgi:hypothetical protein
MLWKQDAGCDTISTIDPHQSRCEGQMLDSAHNNAELASQFSLLAEQFCCVVDEAPGLDRAAFLAKVYSLLPKLIDQAISLPYVELNEDAEEIREPADIVEATRRKHLDWQSRFNLLREQLGDWDSYQEVFDPIHDKEALVGSLADDIADIYRELHEILAGPEAQSFSVEEQIWNWQFSFSCHWGEHAIGALRAIYFRLQRYEI